MFISIPRIFRILIFDTFWLQYFIYYSKYLAQNSAAVIISILSHTMPALNNLHHIHFKTSSHISYNSYNNFAFAANHHWKIPFLYSFSLAVDSDL